MSAVKSTDENISEKKTFSIGHRHLMALIGFLATSFINIQRLVMGVSIVAMVNQTNIIQHFNHTSTSCPITEHVTIVSEIKTDGEFDWSSSTQGYVLGSNFLGHVATQFFAGRVAELWSVKRAFLLGNTLSAVFMFLTPFASWYHVYAMMMVQFLRGIAQGFIVPSVFAMMAKWFPRNERGLLSTLVIVGYSVGAVVGGALAGWICDMPRLGWPYAFHISGILTILFSVFVLIFCYENPSKHPKISKEELCYIQLGQQTDSSGKKLPLPWKAIFSSISIYAVIMGLFGQYWLMVYFISVHPTYMGIVLHYRMTENGVLSSIPLLGKALGGVFASVMSTWLLNRNYVGVDKLRKGCNTIGNVGFCCCLVGIYFGGCNAFLIVVLFILGSSISGIGLSGCMIACVDMSPTFAGTLMGMVSSIASSALVIVPVVVGQLTQQQTEEEWHFVFLITFVVVFGCAVLFHIFGSAEVQPWNHSKDTAQQNELSEKKT